MRGMHAKPSCPQQVPKSGLQKDAYLFLGFSAANALLAVSTYAVSKKLGERKGEEEDS